MAGFLIQAPSALRVPTATTFIMKQNNTTMSNLYVLSQCLCLTSIYNALLPILPFTVVPRNQ